MTAVRQAVLAALQRRAEAATDGPLRDALWAAHARQQQAWGPRDEPVPAAAARAGRVALAALAARCAEQPAREQPRLAHIHARDWTELRLDSRLAAPPRREAPAVAVGPLNAQALVPRALRLLRTLSPDYLQRLTRQVDTLALLADAAASEPEAPGAATSTAARGAGGPAARARRSGPRR